MKQTNRWSQWGAALVVGSALLFASEAPARAEGCGNIAESGICQDPKTLVYCALGELKTMTCAADEICVAHEFFAGSSGCVATRYTGCGDITEAGRCVGDAMVLYCDNDRVIEHQCDSGLTCRLVDGADKDDYYDCVAGTASIPYGPDAGDDDVPPVESDIEDNDDVVEQDPSYPADIIAGPSVARGGAAAASEYGAGGGACGGGGADASLVLTALGLASLAVITGSRRRTARSR